VRRSLPLPLIGREGPFAAVTGAGRSSDSPKAVWIVARRSFCCVVPLSVGVTAKKTLLKP